MPEITKRRVTMSEPLPIKDLETGSWIIPIGGPVTDFVRPDFLDAYVADAKTRWHSVEVSDQPDAGPAGYYGATSVPEQLDHELAGQVFDAEDDPDEKPKRTTGGGGKAGKPSAFFTMQFMVLLWFGALLATIQTVAQRNTLVTAYIGAATHGALYSTAPGSTAGTELTGGSPAYARKALGWGAASGGSSSASVTFDVASGASVQGAGVHTALSGGSYLDGTTVTTQNFASQGTYTCNFAYNQS